MPLDAPVPVQQIVRRCLAKPPAQRYQSMAEVRAALESASGKLAEAQPSIAVLPFANMSRDADDEYFSDGLAEEILNLLAKIPGLKVIARTSSFAFRGKEQDITKIAQTLHVRTILEGSVRRSGSRIRVTAQLISAEDGSHLSSERYDRELADVFAVQDDIAAAITEALKVKLTITPAAAPPHEPNLPAYEACLKGRHYFSKIEPDAWTRAEEYYKQAIALDPQWAEPHAVLAAHYFTLGSFGLRPLSEVVPATRLEASLALDLLPSEPYAHAVLGAIAGSHDYDWKEAGERFRQARAFKPLPPFVRAIYANQYLSPLGRFEEALKEFAQVIAHDPLNVFWRSIHASTLLNAGIYERALIEARKVLELDDTNYIANFYIAHCFMKQEKLKEALESEEAAFRRAPWWPPIVGGLAALLSLSGDQDRANQLITNMSGGALPMGMMNYHLYRDEYAAAIDW